MVKCLFTYILFFGFGYTFAQESSQYTVEKVIIPINGEVYSPAFWNSSLVVCGTRKDRIAHTHLDKNGQEPIDLYEITEKHGVFSYKRFDETFRSDFHDGPISFNANGSHCIISRNLRLDQRFKSTQKEENLLGLFESFLDSGKWTVPVPLEVNNSSYSSTHPALSPDGKTVVFASNMPGGFGGYDLWRMEWKNDTWSKPVNLGKHINSAGNEFFPTWVGATLYFSSNRGEYGGLDIYRVDAAGTMINVKLMEEPINSGSDDFGLISQTAGKNGVFTSNRDGMDQIWSFVQNIPSFENCDSLVNDDFCYTLYEETAYELGGIASLTYQWDIAGEKRYGYEVDYCFPGPGQYEISVDIIDTIIKKTYANQASYTLELSYEEQPYITSPDSVRVGAEFGMNPDKTYLPGVQIENYYWIISDGTNYLSSHPSHSFSEEGVYQVKLGVTGIKEGEPFKDCSYKYIVATNEPITEYSSSALKNMQSFEAEGKMTKSNPPMDDSDTTLVVHSIEIASSTEQLPDSSIILAPAKENYIVNTLFDKEDSIFIYSVGEWVNIADAHNTWINLVEMGYDDAQVFSREKEALSGLPLNESFTLEDVKFEINKWDITESAEKRLQFLVLLLKEFDHVKLSISAHTDDVGGEQDNLLLSKKRAEAIKNYLTNAGVSLERIISEGYGEMQPKFSNETEEGRAKNRRVEFELITTEKAETVND